MAAESNATATHGKAARESLPLSRPATRIRVGVGGWTYEPWRTTFYPAGLPQAQELHYASRQLTAIEVNGTFYGTFKPATFRKWRDETPDGFVFSLKASRFATNRKELSTAGESITRFVESGIEELRDKLGPILWQLMPNKAFDAADLAGFLELLPKQQGSRALRHVLEARHQSFASPDYLALARKHGVSTVFTDSAEHPSFADPTGDVIYARLVNAEAKLKDGYAPAALDAWAAAAKEWAAGRAPAALPHLEQAPSRARAREVFIYFINGAKEKAPAAAVALIKRLG
jgi:uncharacterized protein YecE (DUF72 family)